MRIENPDRSELEEYKVGELQALDQVEKETTLQVDKAEQVVNFYTNIGSHMRKIINSPNPAVEITQVNVRNEKIWQIEGRIPADSITISVKKEPKKQGYLSQMLLS